MSDKVIEVVKREEGQLEVTSEWLQGFKEKLRDHAGSNAALTSSFLNSLPVVDLVNFVIGTAIDRRATDIHIEPRRNGTMVRLREDSMLKETFVLSKEKAASCSSRLKVVSELDITSRAPQDGRFTFTYDDRMIPMRISTLPASYGDTVVIRILDQSNVELSLDSLGFSPDQLLAIRRAIRKTKGLIVVTGPTGSGKTTTLYSMLGELNNPYCNIITIENPVEYYLDRINQVPITEDVNWEVALKTVLRQDPDVVMVGETRSKDIAEICIKASFTGHLVLTTLHTNSAPETVMRLLDMGIMPNMMVSALDIVIAQRLLRRICPSCRQFSEPSKEVIEELAYAANVSTRKISSIPRLASGRGCPDCDNTGYRGRMAVYEVMSISDEIEQLIFEPRVSAQKLQEVFRATGQQTLVAGGLKEVIAGETSVEEFLRVLS